MTESSIGSQLPGLLSVQRPTNNRNREHFCPLKCLMLK
uniref:Uncharacterized protein n=1 Tax=Rhizophora mucronata TaxID=61149 RepID=A0A2P2IXK9_RHIMU